ncbi:MAG: hypothetical protein KTR20_06715 [Cellvibrionaceae bacterium]|nr:hypothetical protein [Cellvibrionaceae bacterium]
METHSAVQTRLTQNPIYQERVVPFTAGDGLALTLIHIRGEKTPTQGPVLLVHGAGVRANIFCAPVEETIVDALIAEGYDVWLENWRASIDIAPNRWTLDQAALYDHPEAVKKVVEETGHTAIKAIIHCQGSTSFTMSAVAGLVPQVKTIVSNAVSLHPIVPWVSKLKLLIAVPPVSIITPYLNPQWGLHAPTWQAKLIDFIVGLTHREAGNRVSKHVSFTYGTGHPTLWNHNNLNEDTHTWLQHEFAQVPLRFFKQITRSVSKGHLLSVENKPELPQDFTQTPPKTTARFAFFAGEDNLCFLPASQIKTYDYFNRLRQDYHSLTVLSGYGHLDVFMGNNASRDVFPIIIDELNKPSNESIQ